MARILKRGDVVLRSVYGRLKSDVRTYTSRTSHSYGGDTVEIQALDGMTDFVLQGHELIDALKSSSWYDSTIECTPTQLAQTFVSVGADPFTVVFTKANGEERTMVGRLVEHEDLLGRSMVHDFDVTKGTPLRQVDHRTLKSLIVDGVRYVLKPTKGRKK